MTTPSQPQPTDRPSRSGATPAMRSLQVLVGGVTGGIVIMGLAMAFILTFTAPPLWAVVLLLAIGLGVHAMVTAAGYRTKPIPPQTGANEANAQAMRVFRSLMMLRMALAESVVLIAIVLAFVTDGTSWFVFAAGAAVSLLLIAVHVWPSRSVVDRVVAGLEKDGTRTGLHDVLGLGRGPGNVEQPPGFQPF